MPSDQHRAAAVDVALSAASAAPGGLLMPLMLPWSELEVSLSFAAAFFQKQLAFNGFD
jgi:hypothetical protein